jgi:hypothetical protein
MAHKKRLVSKKTKVRGCLRWTDTNNTFLLVREQGETREGGDTALLVANKNDWRMTRHWIVSTIQDAYGVTICWWLLTTHFLSFMNRRYTFLVDDNNDKRQEVRTIQDAYGVTIWWLLTTHFSSFMNDRRYTWLVDDNNDKRQEVRRR